MAASPLGDWWQGSEVEAYLAGSTGTASSLFQATTDRLMSYSLDCRGQSIQAALEVPVGDTSQPDLTLTLFVPVQQFFAGVGFSEAHLSASPVYLWQRQIRYIGIGREELDPVEAVDAAGLQTDLLLTGNINVAVPNDDWLASLQPEYRPAVPAEVAGRLCLLVNVYHLCQYEVNNMGGLADNLVWQFNVFDGGGGDALPFYIVCVAGDAG